MLVTPPTPTQVARAGLAHRLALATGLGTESVTVVPRLPLANDAWTHDFICTDEGSARLVTAWLATLGKNGASLVQLDGVNVYAKIH